MATIRDVVEALSRSNGVDAVVVVGRDGLPIDSRVGNGVDADSVAALLPSAIKHMGQLGEAGGRGDFNTAVLEFGGGLAIVTVLNAEALLIVLVLTAEGEDRILREARRLGATLVTKPFSPSKLSQRIAMMFGDSKPEAP